MRLDFLPNLKTNRISIAVINLFIASRVIFYLLSLVIAAIHKIPFNANTFCYWDCHWYNLISQAGYMSKPIQTGGLKGQANWAFFPLEPLIVRFFSFVTSIDPILIAELLGNLFLLGGVLYLSAYLRKKMSRVLVLTTIGLILFSPVNVYFASFYTEALYFFLISAFLYYIQEKEWLVSGTFGSLVGATRMTGLVTLPILIYSFLVSKDRTRRELKEFALALVLMPLGLLLFMYSLYKKNGDPLAFYHVQKYWIEPENPFFWIYKAYKSGDLQQIGFMTILLTCLLASIYFFHKKMYIDFFFIFPICIVSLMSNRYEYRFTLGVYPLYALVSNIAIGRQSILKIIFGLEFILFTVAINSWVIGHGPI